MPTLETSIVTHSAPPTHWKTRSIWFFLLVLAVAAGSVISLFIGAREISAAQIMGNLSNILAAVHDPLSVNADFRVISEQRIPRTLIAVFVGAAIGVAGALIQGHTRNPLADPGIVGVSAGAALGVVAFTGFTGIASMAFTSMAAFLGAIGATVLVFVLANVGAGQLNPMTLVLSGAALSAVLSAFTTSLILGDSGALERMRFWTIGAVNKGNLETLYVLIPATIIGITIAFLMAPQLNLLNLGDDVAQSLGVDAARARVTGIAVIAFLASVATAAAGPISFLGLLTPQIARSICGVDYRWVLPYAAVIGAALLLVADMVGRAVAKPGEIEVGIVLAFVGAPVFLYLLWRNRVVQL